MPFINIAGLAKFGTRKYMPESSTFVKAGLHIYLEVFQKPIVTEEEHYLQHHPKTSCRVYILQTALGVSHMGLGDETTFSPSS